MGLGIVVRSLKTTEAAWIVRRDVPSHSHFELVLGGFTWRATEWLAEIIPKLAHEIDRSISVDHSGNALLLVVEMEKQKDAVDFVVHTVPLIT